MKILFVIIMMLVVFVGCEIKPNVKPKIEFQLSEWQWSKNNGMCINVKAINQDTIPFYVSGKFHITDSQGVYYYMPHKFGFCFNGGLAIQPGDSSIVLFNEFYPDGAFQYSFIPWISESQRILHRLKRDSTPLDGCIIY